MSAGLFNRVNGENNFYLEGGQEIRTTHFREEKAQSPRLSSEFVEMLLPPGETVSASVMNFQATTTPEEPLVYISEDFCQVKRSSSSRLENEIELSSAVLESEQATHLRMFLAKLDCLGEMDVAAWVKELSKEEYTTALKLLNELSNKEINRLFVQMLRDVSNETELENCLKLPEVAKRYGWQLEHILKAVIDPIAEREMENCFAVVEHLAALPPVKQEKRAEEGAIEKLILLIDEYQGTPAFKEWVLLFKIIKDQPFMFCHSLGLIKGAEGDELKNRVGFLHDCSLQLRELAEEEKKLNCDSLTHLYYFSKALGKLDKGILETSVNLLDSKKSTVGYRVRGWIRETQVSAEELTQLLILANQLYEMGMLIQADSQWGARFLTVEKRLVMLKRYIRFLEAHKEIRDFPWTLTLVNSTTGLELDESHCDQLLNAVVAIEKQSSKIQWEEEEMYELSFRLSQWPSEKLSNLCGYCRPLIELERAAYLSPQALVYSIELLVRLISEEKVNAADLLAQFLGSGFLMDEDIKYLAREGYDGFNEKLLELCKEGVDAYKQHILNCYREIFPSLRALELFFEFGVNLKEVIRSGWLLEEAFNHTTDLLEELRKEDAMYQVCNFVELQNWANPFHVLRFNQAFIRRKNAITLDLFSDCIAGGVHQLTPSLDENQLQQFIARLIILDGLSGHLSVAVDKNEEKEEEKEEDMEEEEELIPIPASTLADLWLEMDEKKTDEFIDLKKFMNLLQRKIVVKNR